MRKASFVHLNEKRLYVMSAILVLALVGSLHAIRYTAQGSALITSDAYYHKRLALELHKTPFPKADTMTYSMRPFIITPYDYLLSLSFYLFGEQLASAMLSLFLSIISVLLFNALLKRLIKDIRIRALATLFLIMSPGFIYAYTTSNPNSLAALLCLSGTYLVMGRGKQRWIGLFTLSTLPLFGLVHGVLAILALLSYASYKKENKLLIIGMPLVLLCELLYYLLYYSKLPHEKVSLLLRVPLQSSLAILGGRLPFSSFLFLLFLLGVMLTWNKKRKGVFYLTLLFLLVSSFWREDLRIYLTFFIAVFAAEAFAKIVRMKWKLEIVKNLTLVTLLCGILFSSLVYANMIITSEPTREELSSLRWLKNHSGENSVVLSHYSYGFIIESEAERKTILDPLLAVTPKAAEIINDTNTSFYTRELKKAKEIFDKYNTSYLWITSKMKEELVWEEPEQGLLFLFRNNETFKNVYNTSSVEIWEVISR